MINNRRVSTEPRTVQGRPTYSYSTYGQTTGHTGTASTPMQYGAGYSDAETGLIYLQHRYYDPATAQFLTIDPKLADTRQPYLYVGDDPLNGVDPTGLCWSGFGWVCSAGHAVAHAAASAYKHVSVGVTFCVILCASVSFQGGHIQASRGGLGFGGFAPSVSWNSATPDKQEPWTFGSCVSFDFGLCGAIGGRSPYKYNSSNPSDRHHWYSVGVTGGEGASLGGSYTWLDWNLGDPLHPTIFGCHPFGR